MILQFLPWRQIYNEELSEISNLANELIQKKLPVHTEELELNSVKRIPGIRYLEDTVSMTLYAFGYIIEIFIIFCIAWWSSLKCHCSNLYNIKLLHLISTGIAKLAV